MKKSSFLSFVSLPFVVCFVLLVMLFSGTAQAQTVLAKWPLLKLKTNPPAGPFGCLNVATGVNTGAGMMVYDDLNTFSAATPNGQGAKLKTINNYVWPSAPIPDAKNPNFNLAFPLSPATGYDLDVTGISFTDSGKSGLTTDVVIGVAPYYQIDGKGAWIPFGTPQTFSGTGTVYVDFGTFNQYFYSKGVNSATHSYVIKLCFYTTTPAITTKNDNFTLNNVVFYGKAINPAVSSPTVTTSSALATGKYSASVTGAYDFGATFQNPTSAGVTWSTSPSASIASSPFTIVGASGKINSTITGLSAKTTYYVRAYVITQADTIYDSKDLSFTTADYTAPVVTTSPASSVLSNKATINGVIVDSGGLPIIDKYIKYGLNTTNLSNTVRPMVNSGSDPFSVVIKQLQPNTTYYYQACASNSNNLSNCGNVESFKTSDAVPTLATTSNAIDFGDVVYNSTAPIISFTLSGGNFTSASGVITINMMPSSGFIMSTSPTIFPSSPVSSISVPFSNNSIKKPIPIYIKCLTGSYGSFNSTITLSGGGVAAQDADKVTLTANVIPSPDQLSNMGTDFWTGFAYQNSMSEVPTIAKAAQMSIYIAAGNTDANVTVELPGIAGAVGFPQSFKIPANTVKEITNFPIGTTDQYNSGNGPDSRLYYTGISKRGVHITSTNGVPVAVWMHTYTINNSAGATMVFPTNTWGASYSVQGYGGTTNAGKASSFFFVMAKEDNTDIEFTPSNDIVDSSKATLFQEGNSAANVKYAKGKTYKITLNKGEIFNAMAFVQGTGANSAIGLDLSGTTIKTVDCSKKIAVFAGSGRVLVATSTGSVGEGSDNLVQQMFPKVAWGTKYLTIPTKTMEYNVFRINVGDVTTKVWLNTSVHTTATALPISQFNSLGQYYQIEGNQPNIIESDKPISLTQFIIAGSAPDGKNKTTHPTIGNGGLGDPEMIILSPVQQAINSATVYSSNFKNGNTGGSYINVVIKNSGIDSFKLDGKQTADTGINSYAKVGVPAIYGPSNTPNLTMKQIFKVHPGDPNYSYAMFRVASGVSHTITSNVPFNAIAYGMADGESYGYNAGTAINNLSSIKIIENPSGQDTSSSVIRTCKNNLVRLQIALPYSPSQVDNIVWTAPNNSNINLSGTSINGPTMTDPNNPGKSYADTSGLLVVDGQTFYIYTCPVQYQFKDFGFYPIVATAHGNFASECTGTDAQKIYVQVTGDNIDFKAIQDGCGSKNVKFTDNSIAIPGASIVKWDWDFGDNTSESITNKVNPNPTINPHSYPNLNAYWAKLTTTSSVGCLTVDSVQIDLASGIRAGFLKDRDTVCINSNVTFTDTSSSKAYTRKWNFGEPSSGANDSLIVTNATTPVTHTYTTSGKHIITLQVFTAGTPTCASNVFTDSVYVSTLPKPNFTFGGVCLPGSTVFTNTSDAATGFAPYKYSWDFGEPTSGLNNSATTTDGTHTYTPPKPSAGYTVKLTATNRFGCSADVSQNVNTVYEKPTAIITPVTNNICFGDSTVFTDASTAANGQKIVKWNWDFADAPTDTVQNPKHKFSAVNAYTVKLSVITDQGCKADTFTVVKISPIPVAGFRLPSSCLGGGNVTFTDTSTITDASLMPFKFAWNFGDAASNANNVSADQNAQHDYTAAGVGSYTVAETVSASNGCKATSTRIFEIAGSKPIPSFEIVGTSICSNLPIQLKDTSRIALGTIKKVEIVWDVVGKPTVVEVDSVSPSNGATGKFKIYTHKYPELSADKSYTIKLTAYSGTTCFDVYSQTITVHGTPVVTFANQVFICANASPRDFIPAKETSGLAGAFTYSGAGVSGVSFNPKKAAVGKDSITAIYTTNDGCKDTAYSVIQVMDTIGVTLNPRTINMCKKDSIQLTPISKAGEYAWSETDVPNNTFVNGITNTKSVWVKPTGNITQYVVVANASNCPTTDTVTIYAARYPSVIITSPRNKETTICYGADTKLTVNTISPNITWTPVDSISGSNTLKSIVVNPRDTTKFVVTVSDNSYCTKSVSDTVTVNVLPNFAIGIHVGSDTSTRLTPGDSLIMLAYVTDTAYKAHLDYSWFPITYLNDPDTSRPILLPVLPLPNPTKTTYTVTATNAAKCKAKASIDIDFYRTQPDILVPTAFSPNGDGKNDKLIPFPIGITHFGFFRVFNRSGQLVFSTNQIGVGWDGTIQGQPADPGTYIWMTDGVDYKGKAHPHGGSVVLLR